MALTTAPNRIKLLPAKIQNQVLILCVTPALNPNGGLSRTRRCILIWRNGVKVCLAGSQINKVTRGFRYRQGSKSGEGGPTSGPKERIIKEIEQSKEGAVVGIQ